MNRSQLRETLIRVSTGVQTVREGAGDRSLEYFRWVNNSVRVLRNLVSGHDLDRLVLTWRYRSLLSMAEVDGHIGYNLLSLELDERAVGLAEACRCLDEQIARWSGPEVFAVADTTVYATYREPIETVDLAAVLDCGQTPVRLLVPILVIDELEALTALPDVTIRRRARATLALFDRLFADSVTQAATLDSGTRVELVFEPPGHERLPVGEDEIVDRTLAIEPLAGRPVTLLTCETSQMMRAKAAGLPARRMPVAASAVRREPTTAPVGGEPASL